MCLKDDIKRAQNSSNLTLSSLNDESDNLYKDSSDFVVTLPPHPNPHNYKQALIQLKSLHTPPTSIVKPGAWNETMEPIVMGVSIGGLGINNSYISGHSSDIIGHGIVQSPSMNQTHEFGDGKGLQHFKKLVGDEFPHVTNGAIVLNTGLGVSPGLNGSLLWRVDDEFYILPRFGTANPQVNTDALAGANLTQYVHHNRRNLAVGKVLTITNVGGLHNFLHSGTVETWKMLSNGSAIYTAEDINNQPDPAQPASLKNSANAGVAGGFRAIWKQWREDEHSHYLTTFSAADGVNNRDAAGTTPSLLRVMCAEHFHSTTGSQAVASGFVNDKSFFDDSVLCGNPFGKRLHIKIVNMMRPKIHRTTDGNAYDDANAKPNAPPTTHYETMKESHTANVTGTKINTEHPIVVGLRVMLIDPEDLKN